MSESGDDAPGFSNDKRRKRLSILKPPKSPNRSALQDLDTELNFVETETTTRTRFNRRVSFADKYQVKEFHKDSVTLAISNKTELVPITGSDESSSVSSLAIDNTTCKSKIFGLDSLLSGKIQATSNVFEDDHQFEPTNLDKIPFGSKRKHKNSTSSSKDKSEPPIKKNLSEDNDDVFETAHQFNQDKTIYFDNRITDNDMSFTQVTGGIDKTVHFEGRITGSEMSFTQVTGGIIQDKPKVSSHFILGSLITSFSQKTDTSITNTRKWNDDKENLCTIVTDDESTVTKLEESEKADDDGNQIPASKTILFGAESSNGEMELTECVTNVDPKKYLGKSKYDDDSENVKVVDKHRSKTILDVDEMELTNVGGEVTTEDDLEVKKFEMNATNAAGEIKVEVPEIINEEALEAIVHSAGKVGNKTRRRTILEIEEMDLTDTGGEIEVDVITDRRRTISGPQDMELTDVLTFNGNLMPVDQVVKTLERRGTIHNVEDMEFTNVGGKIEVSNSNKSRRKSILEMVDMEFTNVGGKIEVPNTNKNRRKSVLEMVDMEFTDVGGKIEVPNTNKSRRKSILKMVDMELTEVNSYTNTEPEITEEIVDSSYLTSLEDKRKTFVVGKNYAEKNSEDDVSPVADTSRKDMRRTIILDGGEEMELTSQSDRDTSVWTASVATKESKSTLKEQSVKEICSKVNLVGSPKSGHSSLNVTYENTAVLLKDTSQILKMNEASRDESVIKILPFVLTNEENEIVVESPEVDRKEKSVLGILQSVETGGIDLNISNPSSEDLISEITCELLDGSYDDSKCCGVEVREEVKVQKTMNLITPHVKKLLDETKFLAKNVKFSSEKMADEKKRLKKLGVVDERLRVGTVKKGEGLGVVEESLVESMKRMLHEIEGVGTSDDEYNVNCKWIPFLEAADKMLESITKAENKLDEMMDAIPSVTDIQRMQQLDARILEREKELKAKQIKLEKEKEKVKVLSQKKEKLKRKTDVVLKEKEDCENNLKKYEKQAAELQKKAQREWRHREGSFQYHNETGLGISYFEKSLLLDIKYGKSIRAPKGFSHLPAYKIGSITLKPQDNGQKETNLLKLCHWLILEGINQNEFLKKSPTTFELYKVLGEVSIVVGDVRLLIWDLEDIYNSHAIKVEDKTIWVTFSHMGAHVHFNLGFDLTPNSYPHVKLHPKIEITIGQPELKMSILEVVDEVEPSARYMRKIIARVDSYLNSLIQ